MELKIKILDEGFDPTKTKMTCVSKHKYSDVELCFNIGNGNSLISFAELSANDGTYSDKESQFEALKEIGENLANAWNEKYNLK